MKEEKLSKNELINKWSTRNVIVDVKNFKKENIVDNFKTFSSAKEMMEEFEKNKKWYRTLLRLEYLIFEDILNPRMIYKRTKWLLQRIFRGYDDTVTWSLDYTIAKFVLPRLKLFKKEIQKYKSVPGIFQHTGDYNDDDFDKEFILWLSYIDKMILSFELIVKDDWKDIDMYEENQKKIKEGLELFAIFFQSLWS